MYNKKVWNTGERITADKLNNIEEGIYSNALVNKTQQVYINGFFNENKDGRLSVEGEGNDLKLEGSKQGLVEVDKIVGNTLINISPHYTLNCTLTSDYDNFKPLLQNTYGSDSMPVGRVIQDIKPTTTYTIIYKIKQIPTEGVYLLNNPNTNAIFSTYIQISSTDTLGIKCAILTSESDLTNKYVVLRSQNRNGRGTVEVEVIAILEGNYTNKPIPSDVFEGLQSSFESNLVTQEMVEQGLESEENLGKYKVPVRLVGKNKCPVSSYSQQATKWSDTLTMLERVVYKNIKISPTSKYIVSMDDSTGYGIAKILGHYTPLSEGVMTHSEAYSRTLKEGGKEYACGSVISGYSYITITTGGYYPIERIPENSIVEFSNIQIEEGIVATDYEDYFERTTNVYLNSPLLKGDEIVMKDGELCHWHTRLIGVLDDTLKWTTNGENTIQFIAHEVLPNIKYGISSNTQGIIHASDATQIRTSVTSGKIVYHAPSDRTLDEFINEIKNNPVTVVYELAEPYYEPIQADKLLLECANDSTLHIDSIVPVENISASYTTGIPNAYLLQETNDNQDSLIDISLCATDEMYLMIEPLLEAIPQTLNNERMISKMVDMYVAMVIRGLKTIDEVPVRYREQVKEILAQLEK